MPMAWSILGVPWLFAGKESPQKVAEVSGKWDPLYPGKCRLVKYYDLARIIGATEKSFRIIQRNGDLFGQIEGRWFCGSPKGG